MARELVLRALRSHSLGELAVTTGTDSTQRAPASNRVLTSAWLSVANVGVRALYGIIVIRFGDPAVTAKGIFLVEGWFGAAGHVPGGADNPLHSEGIAWYGELPLFEEQDVTILFTVRNDTGATVTHTGGYTWQEWETNDRPS